MCIINKLLVKAVEIKLKHEILILSLSFATKENDVIRVAMT